MIAALRDLDPKTAAGILAQTALKLDGFGKTPSPLIHNQEQVEKLILDQVRAELAIAPTDHSRSAVDLITDALDRQADELIELDEGQSLIRLGESGRLPSDVYEIRFIPNLAAYFGHRWIIEQQLAIATIRGPHTEQVLGSLGGNEPGNPQVSLFARFYNHRFPARSFWMLVLADRQLPDLWVHQVWRVYSQEVDLTECEDIIDVVRSFANRYGTTIELDNKKAKFFFQASIASTTLVADRLSFENTPGVSNMVTWFRSKDGGSAFMVIPINLTAYFKSVEKWKGWEKHIIEDLGL